ncbi:MAG: RagB/SusD family nutrient uptake outer membrane protein [Gemmatimonadota bacterium]
MKKPILLSAVAALLLGAACQSLDENLVTGVSGDYYATPDGLNSALTASYAQLRNFYGREQLLSLTQVGTDTWESGDQLGSNNLNFDAYNGTLNSSAGELNNTWNPAYQMINALNTAIDHGITATGLTPALKNQLLAEAHFLRALEYFTLVRQFGSVSIILHENKGVVATAVRDTVSEVFKVILADLDTASAGLPATTSDFGRATKYAAVGLRSLVYLTRAYKSYADASDFQRAATNADSVINSGVYALEPVYADLWCVARASDPGRGNYCENTGYNGNKKEFIFTVQFRAPLADNDADNEYNYLHLVFLGQYDAATVGVGLGRDINNGRPFRRLKPTPYGLKLFQFNHYFGTPATPGVADVLDTRYEGSYQNVWTATAAIAAPGNGVGTCPNCTSGGAVGVGDTTIFYPNYPVTNAFRQSKAYKVRTICPASEADPTKSCPNAYVAQANDGYFNWAWYPSLKKFQDNLRLTVSDQNGGKVEPILRLGEMYLIAAEAYVNLGQTQTAADRINVIRRRAASAAHKTDNDISVAQLTTMDPNIPGSVSRKPGLDFVMEEREREMAGEMTRWYDITRPGPEYFLARVKAYNKRAETNVIAKHWLRPIPQTQIDGVIVGPKYPQNPGY